jgi:hypothetical protein
MGLPYVNTEFLALARWPAFFNVYCEALRGILGSPLFVDCQHRTRKTAWELAQELSAPVELSAEELRNAGMTAGEVASVIRLLRFFLENLSGLVMAMVVAKIGLEGGNGMKSGSIPPASEPSPAERPRRGRVA